MRTASKRHLLVAGFCVLAIISAIAFFIALGEANERVDRAYAEETRTF